MDMLTTGPAGSPVVGAAGERTQTRPPALSFRIGEDGVKLLAVFDPAGDKPGLDIHAVREMLMMQGLSELLIDENALAQLVRQYATATAAFTLPIGERHDGECTIRVADDLMTAWMTLTWPRGGERVTRAKVDRLLREKNIVYGILEDEIEAALAEGVAQDRVIARGKEPVPGTDARFESLLPEIRDRRPRVDENGIADYRDLGDFVIVRQGDGLMHRIPAVPGENGMDIHGRTVFAKAGKDTPFAPALKGTTTDPQDSNLLVSAITGQPVLVHPNGVVVEPTVTVPQVNLATGNVKFEGAVHVKGDVKSGMKIHADGDVIVDGTVESAEIEAGGDVIIKGGMIGSGESRRPANAPKAKICCQGTLSARFLENVYAKAGVDIVIEEFSMHSELIAKNQVVVGKPGTKKGHIRGGRVCASTLVRAAVIGMPNGIKTKVQVGLNAAIEERLEKVKVELDTCEQEQEKLEKLIAFLCQHPERNRDGMQEKAQNTLNNLYAEMARLFDEQRELKAALTLADQARVLAEHNVYIGTEIQIGNRIWRANDEYGRCVFQLNGGEIECSS